MAGEEDLWEIYQDRRREFRWRRKTNSGDIVGASCESFVNRRDCQANAQRHGMDGNPRGLGTSDYWNTYQDRRGEWRWRRQAASGEITGSSSQSYANKSDAILNAVRNGLKTSLEVSSRLPTMREFILELLSAEHRPMTIDEIVEEFELAGYETVRSSVRGRLNSLTYDGLIARVARATYASHVPLAPSSDDRKTKVSPSLEDSADTHRPPLVPAQRNGVTFGISPGGRIGLVKTGLLSTDDDTAQVEAMRQIILQALDDLLNATQGSNAFVNIHRIAAQYADFATGTSEQISIEHLYALGIRLDNANERLKIEISKGELPDTGIRVGEALDSVLAIHGPMILSTQRGRELVELSRQFNATQEQQLAYRQSALKVVTAIANDQDMIEPEVRKIVEPLTKEIGEGRFPERTFSLARLTNQNLLVALATATFALTIGGAGTEAFITSVPGADLVAISKKMINSIYAFFGTYGVELRQLAAVAGQELSWVSAFLDWWERKKDSRKLTCE